MLGCFEWWRSIPTSPPLEALLLPFSLPVALSIDKAIFVAWQNHGCPSSTLLMPFLCFIQRDDDLHINYFLPFPLPPPWHCQFSHLPLALCFFLFAFPLALPCCLLSFLYLLEVSILLTKPCLFLLCAISPFSGQYLCCFFMAFPQSQAHWTLFFTPFSSFSIFTSHIVQAFSFFPPKILTTCE